jgi:hypothetical protein
MKEKVPFGKYLPEMTTTNRATLKPGESSVWVVLTKESDNSILPVVFSKFENAIKYSNKVRSRLLDPDLKAIPCQIKSNADI